MMDQPSTVALQQTKGATVSDEKLSVLPSELPDYRTRQAARLRALAESATTARLRVRLLPQAEEHDRLAVEEDEPD